MSDETPETLDDLVIVAYNYEKARKHGVILQLSSLGVLAAGTLATGLLEDTFHATVAAWISATLTLVVATVLAVGSIKAHQDAFRYLEQKVRGETLLTVPEAVRSYARGGQPASSPTVVTEDE